MTEGFVTVQSLNWQDKIYKAQPQPSTGNRCVGCAFRVGGDCGRPGELYAYTCVDTLRSDYRGIVWVKED